MIRMMIRIAMLAALPMVLSGAMAHGDTFLRTADRPEAVAEAAAMEPAARELQIGRYYVDKHNYPGAINRLKTVITQHQGSPEVEEALVYLTESYLALGIHAEAQTAAAVFDRKFPNSPWAGRVHDALAAAGLTPVENGKSRIK